MGLPRPRGFKHESLRIINQVDTGETPGLPALVTQGPSCSIAEFVTHQHRGWEGVQHHPSEVLLHWSTPGTETGCSSWGCASVLSGLVCPALLTAKIFPPQLMPEPGRERGRSNLSGKLRGKGLSAAAVPGCEQSSPGAPGSVSPGGTVSHRQRGTWGAPEEAPPACRNGVGGTQGGQLSPVPVPQPTCRLSLV